MTTTTDRDWIQPGVYDDLPEEVYHADPGSVSASGLKTILKAPAKYLYQQTHPREHKDYFDVGTATHSKILGTGAPAVAYPEDVLSSNGQATTNAAKAFAKEVRAEGKIPLLQAQLDAVDAMAESVLANPSARRLLTGGRSEVSLFWYDERYDVNRRARVDHLTDGIADLKTTVDADPSKLDRTIVNFGYDLSAAQYLDVARGLDLDPAFYALIFVEKEPPYLVAPPVELSATFLTRGRSLCEEALERYRDCRDSGIWPGYSTEPFITIHPPRWA